VARVGNPLQDGILPHRRSKKQDEDPLDRKLHLLKEGI
jgi:hypothetical protein